MYRGGLKSGEFKSVNKRFERLWVWCKGKTSAGSSLNSYWIVYQLHVLEFYNWNGFSRDVYILADAAKPKDMETLVHSIMDKETKLFLLKSSYKVEQTFICGNNNREWRIQRYFLILKGNSYMLNTKVTKAATCSYEFKLYSKVTLARLAYAFFSKTIPSMTPKWAFFLMKWFLDKLCEVFCSPIRYCFRIFWQCTPDPATNFNSKLKGGLVSWKLAWRIFSSG